MAVFLTIYGIVTLVLLVVQGLTLAEAWRHLMFTLRRYRPRGSNYRPPVAVIVPCKGLDHTFDRNIRALFQQSYPDYRLVFVVESESDPACGRLGELIAEAAVGAGAGMNDTVEVGTAGGAAGAHEVDGAERQGVAAEHDGVTADDVTVAGQDENGGVGAAAKGCLSAEVVIAGEAVANGQKVHNQLAGVKQVGSEVEVLVFVDSDACPKPHFLGSLVHPLWRETVGASTGYRWYVPTDGRLSSHMLSAMNGVVASLLGPHRWNSAWGGAMAMRREVFESLGIKQLWANACSDDYVVTWAVKRAGLRIAFAPSCFVASYDRMSWGQLFEFARRQFILTRVYRPPLWWLALLGFGSYSLGFWGGLVTAAVLAAAELPYAGSVLMLPCLLLVSSMLKGLARQWSIGLILPEERQGLRGSAVLDIVFGPLVALVMWIAVFAAGFKREIVWRGVRYVLINAGHTEIRRHETTSEGR